ncbi:MAG: hypothetical protein QOF04_524, partial [Solirubrobacteraceae bacterium]|nr:hypothetical protein [Solirubrobacteraceae bacterium]
VALVIAGVAIHRERSRAPAPDAAA